MTSTIYDVKLHKKIVKEMFYVGNLINFVTNQVRLVFDGDERVLGKIIERLPLIVLFMQGRSFKLAVLNMFSLYRILIRNVLMVPTTFAHVGSRFHSDDFRVFELLGNFLDIERLPAENILQRIMMPANAYQKDLRIPLK